MAEPDIPSLLLAILELPEKPELKGDNESDLKEDFNGWRAEAPAERTELMLRVLYDVLHHSVMMGPGGVMDLEGHSTFGTMLARVLTGHEGMDGHGHDRQFYIKELRRTLKQDIENNLDRLKKQTARDKLQGQ